MSKAPISAGQKFGRLTVLSKAERRRQPCGNVLSMWLCQCDCGNTATVRAQFLKDGHTTSCGCAPRGRHIKHGASTGGEKSPEYASWIAMLSRCGAGTKGGKPHKDYGGRGITVCERWRTFTAFLEDMRPKPSPDHSIERNDVNGNYEPSNCRWATFYEQQQNRRNTVRIRGRLLAEVCIELGLSVDMVYRRMLHGWPEEKWLVPPFAWRLSR